WLPQAKGKIVMVSPAWPTCRPSEDWFRWSTPESMARIDTEIGEMQRDWSVMMGPDGKPDSTKLYRGTGYSLALGTGPLGTRLEKAGVLATISSRPKLAGFPNPFPNAGAGGRGGRGGRGGGGGASDHGGGPTAAEAAAFGRGGRNAPEGSG